MDSAGEHLDGSSSATAHSKYPVFISYSHRDERWASWLHKGIEGYRVPKPLVGRPGRDGPIPGKIFPVFRDRDELASSSDLPAALQDALAQSGHLIVLCSPAAAHSRWVNQEITEFKRLGRADRIFPLIVDGEPHAAAPARECFPPALRFEVDGVGRLTEQPAEPVAADLRPEGDGKENARLKLIAGVLGVPFNELRRREEIEERRRTRIRRGIGAAMGLLALSLVAAGLWGLRNERQAEDLLIAGIKNSADSVVQAVRYADHIGVPRDMIAGTLAGAESLFEAFFSVIPEPPAAVRGQYGVLLLVLADQNGIIGDIEQQRTAAERAHAVLEVVVKEEPSDPEWGRQLALAYDLVAGALATEWQVDGALEGYQKALRIREKLAQGDQGKDRWQREIGLSHINIGDMLRRQGQWAAALEEYRKALKIQKRLAAALSDLQLKRDLLMGQQRVGDMLLKQEEYAAAEADYRAALAIAEHLSAAEPTNVQARRDLSVSLAKLGDALQRQGKTEEALQRFQSSLTTAQELAAGDPENIGLQRDMFKSHEAVGSLRFEEGDLDEAKSEFEASITIAERLSAADPANKLIQRELSVLRNRLGEVFEARGQLDEAIEEYRNGLKVRGDLAQTDPTNAQAQRDLSLSYERVADVLRQQSRWEEALDAYNASLAIARQLAESEPANLQWQRELAIAHHNVARVLEAQGQDDAALEAYQDALAAAQRYAAGEEANVHAQRDLLARYSNLAQLQERGGSRAEAQRTYCRAKAVVLVLTDLEPDSDEWRERRAWVEQRLRAQDDGPAPC